MLGGGGGRRVHPSLDPPLKRVATLSVIFW